MKKTIANLVVLIHSASPLAVLAALLFLAPTETHAVKLSVGYAGLEVIDVSNPPNCMLVGDYNTSGFASGVAMVAGRIYVADTREGLLVLPTLLNVQFTVRVDATPGVSFTFESATNLSAPIAWSSLLTTNVATMPFDYVDFDVKLTNHQQKFYRVRQP